MIKHEPHALLGVALFDSINALYLLVVLQVDRGSPPDFRCRQARVEIGRVDVMCTFLQEDFADE